MSGPSFAQKLCNILKLVVIIFLCLIVWSVILLPICLLPLFILFLIRKCVDFVVLSLHHDWKPITGLDSVYASATTRNYSGKQGHCFANAATCLVVEGRVSVDELRNKFEQCLFNQKATNGRDWKYWKLRCKPKQYFGNSYWVPLDQINLREHFKECPPGGEPAGVQHDLNYIMNEWLPLGFDERSPWEFLIFIPQLGKFVGKSLIFMKINHVVGGGVSMRYLLLKLLDLKEDEKVQPDIIKASLLERIYDAITIPRAAMTLAKSFIQSKREASTRLGNISNTGESLTVFDYVNIDAVKNAKRKLNCSFREVLSTALGSALRKHLIDSNNYSKLPNNLIVVYQMHPPYSAHPKDSLVNHQTMIHAKYPLVEQSSRIRIANFRQDMKNNFRIGTHKLSYHFWKLAYIFNPEFAVNQPLAPYLSISDVPFVLNVPVNGMLLLGKQVSGIHGMLSLEGFPMLCVGGFVTIGTKLCVSIVANKAIVHDSSCLEKIFQTFKEELLWMGAEESITESTTLLEA